MTKIVINGLSAESLSKAANRVRKLQKAYYNKNREFVRRLTEAGLEVITESLGQMQGDSEAPTPNRPHVRLADSGINMQAVLRLHGEDVMFVEFGAGIHYNGSPNSSPNPKGIELGYTIGSYGKHQGLEDHWFYEDDNGITVISYGTKAVMPMWKADLEIRQKFASIAKEVFAIKGV